ncbi:MAG TPA: integration host factor, actinobacterial type [Candidatus Babeliales bacterium]|nr:integration host factor, actinobacterial type [Candidatus Babeliales bacterium]
MSLEAPPRTQQQRMQALKKANDIRIRRAMLKKGLQALPNARLRRAAVRAIIVKPPDYVGSMQVCDLLKALPGFGKVKAGRILSQCRISQSKTFGGLSNRQRKELLAKFADPT